MNQKQLEKLVRNASLSADLVAVEELSLGASQAQVTRRIVRRTIEFLIGNGLVSFVKDGSGMWLQLDPPYDEVITGADSEE